MVNRYDDESHLVILGAGATCAAFPKGDFFGRKIPAMNGFIEKTGIGKQFPDLKEMFVKYPNLEDLYSELSRDKQYSDELERLNRAIWSYMSQLFCGYKINLYDKLVLSLTDRDCIASFNWDPFLAQSIY